MPVFDTSQHSPLLDPLAGFHRRDEDADFVRQHGEINASADLRFQRTRGNDVTGLDPHRLRGLIT
ncbi:hypothetical protein [Bifidobacterium longum]|uniref:hypothetical protein n=1 Tax=Bifidobacterium longum TaxID=216816 RepID=UPI00298FBB8C|nr:hypothetical protein [Bifidobacterium longum]